MEAWYVHVTTLSTLLTTHDGVADVLQDLSMWIGLGNIMSVKLEGDKVCIKWSWHNFMCINY